MTSPQNQEVPLIQANKPRLAVMKFASCDGCQLSLLDCEDELLLLGEVLHIANFAEASSAIEDGPYDITLVEGSITTPHDRERIQEVRKHTGLLISIGACATSGGIQALRNIRDHEAMMRMVYANPSYIDTLATSTPIAAHVHVDFELRGCPVSKSQLLELIAAYLHGRKPNIARTSVCVECKMRAISCVLVSSAEPCLGAITNGGCNALCPSYRRGCFGCFGPKEDPNATSLGDRLVKIGIPNRTVRHLFHGFNVAAEPMLNEGNRHDDSND